MQLKNILQRVNVSSLFRALPSLSSNYLNLMLERRDRCAPFYIFWLLSYRCNLRCRHCNSVWSKTGPENLERELNQDQKLDVASQIAKSRTWGITLSGGEPLMDPALPEIIRRLKVARKFVNLCTNGVLLGQFAQELVDMDVDVVTVSMDSHRREAHDQYRGAAGAYDHALAGLEAVMSLRRKTSPRLVVKNTLSSDNFRELTDYVPFFSSRADAVEFQPVQNNFGHQVKEMNVLFKPEQEKPFRNVITELISRHPQFDNPYYRGMADFIFRPQDMLQSGRFKCLFPSAMSLCIDPYGNAGGCPGRNLTGGNLREKLLTEIWRSESNFNSQKQMRSNPAQCICWYHGTQLNSYIMPLYNILHS